MSHDNTSRMLALLGELRRDRNGMAADAMCSYGGQYGVNYGVAAHTIRDRARAEGKAIDKLVNALNNVLGGANLKPAQKRDDLDASLANTPMGVWLYRYENLRPLPEVDEDLKDVNGTKKYMFTWMGHLCKMLGIKNGYTRLYEEEIGRLRVERPEYDDEDDESLLIDAYSDNTEDDEE